MINKALGKRLIRKGSDDMGAEVKKQMMHEPSVHPELTVFIDVSESISNKLRWDSDMRPGKNA